MKAFPYISPSGYQGLVTDACCTNTIEADTQWMFSSSFTKVAHNHNVKFGGEKRIFLNNFWQPTDTSGEFYFGSDITQQNVFTNNSLQGNSLASMLLGWADYGNLGVRPRVANKSAETAFYIQDDWRVNSRLTVNLGLRYEWSTPYTERYDRNQFSNFYADSGVFVPQLCDPSFPTCTWPGKKIIGTTTFASSSFRHPDSDLDNWAPRLGFAYRLDQKTVVRGGAGVYYGLNYATNWQYGGRAWNKDVAINFSTDGNLTRFATMENPFPVGFVGPQETKYGPLALWGFDDSNHASNTFRNGEIYQWNIGIERELPGQMVIDAAYSANHSVHLPWNYSPANRNFISAALREQYGSNGLGTSVANPFQYLFTQVPGMPAPIFNEPDSIYNNPTVPLINLLRPYPQFPGSFSGFPPFEAESMYDALYIRFEKRFSRGLSFEGNYTYSHFISESDEGGNAWIGRLSQGEPQDLNNLSAERSVSANDTPHRLVFAVLYELPVGRGRALGNNMGRLLDGFVGGWNLNTLVTFQSGQPINVSDANGALADGNQRPNVSGTACSSFSIDQVVDCAGNYFNLNAFSHAADQMPGNAPRYFSNCRVPGIHSMDLGIEKRFSIKESMYFEFRAEFFNALNTPRFGAPGSSFGSDSFGIINNQQNSPRHGQIGLRFVY